MSASQTCPSFTGGYTTQSPNHGSGLVGIFLDTSPDHLIPCEATVYAWHYCYYPTSANGSSPVLSDAVFAVYYYDNTTENYVLREQSRFPLSLSTRESSFTCGTVNLNESDYFQVYAGDSVGVCLIEDGAAQSYQLDMVTSHASGSSVHWRPSSRRCRLSDMRESVEGYNTESMPYLIHLSVDLSKYTYHRYYTLYNIPQTEHIIILALMLNIDSCRCG